MQRFGNRSWNESLRCFESDIRNELQQRNTGSEPLAYGYELSRLRAPAWCELGPAWERQYGNSCWYWSIFSTRTGIHTVRRSHECALRADRQQREPAVGPKRGDWHTHNITVGRARSTCAGSK